MSTYIRDNTQLSLVSEFHVDDKVHRYRQSPIGLLPGMLRRLLDERTRVKRQMDDENISHDVRTILDERQQAIKVCANAVYGVMGARDSVYTLHCPSSEVVTYIGREYVRWLRRHIQATYPVLVPYGDTDSCYLTPITPCTKQEMIEMTTDIVCRVNSLLPQHIKLAYERHYDTVIMLTKKKYILISDGVASHKGTLVIKRDYCEYARCIYRGLLHLVLSGDASYDNVLDYLSDMYADLLHGKVSKEMLVLTKGVKARYSQVSNPMNIMLRRLRSVGTPMAPGSRVQFLYADVGDVQHQGDKMYTPDEIELHGMHIDYRYYIERHISPSISELIKAIGYPLLEINAYSRAVARYDSF
jgi:DNA polymerase elongation subunit (family B)